MRDYKFFNYTRQKIELLFLNSDFLDKAKTFKLKHGLRTDSNVAITDEIKSEFSELLKPYNLPRHMHKLILSMILFNNLDMTYESDMFFPYVPENSLKRFQIIEQDGRLMVEIFPDTAVADISKHWNLIKERQKNLPGYSSERSKEMLNFERDKKLWLLRAKGHDYKEIVEMYNSEAENESDLLGYNDVLDIIKRFSRKIAEV